MKKLMHKSSIPTYSKSVIIAVLDDLMSQRKMDKDSTFFISRQMYNDCQFYKMTEYKGIKIQPLY